MPDLSPSVLNVSKIKLESIFKTHATVNPELSNRPISAAMVLGKQTANTTPIMDGAGRDCVGVTAWYHIADVTALPATATSPIAGTCDLTTGDQVSTKSQTYNLNFFEKPSILINDKDCDNNSKFAERMAFAFGQKMSLMVQALNADIITGVEANKSVAAPGNLPVGVTVSGGDYAITAAGAWTGVEAADTLLTLDQLAAVRGLPSNYYILSGKALQISSQLAENKVVNDNQRSYVRLFNRRDISYDVDNLDVLIGESVIYLIDPNTIVSYFHSEYPETPEPVGDKNGTMRWSMPLMFHSQWQDGSDQMLPLTYMNNGVSTTVRIDVRHQKVCNVVLNKYGKPSSDHIFELDMMGLFDFIPKEGVNTGILRVDQT